MPKKIRTNSKALEARERKATEKASKKAAASKAAEDAKWTDEGKDKASQRKAAADAKRQEELRKRAEKKRLAEEDEAKVAKEARGKNAANTKVTQRQILSMADQRKAQAEQLAKERKLAQQKIVKQMEVSENVNHIPQEEQWMGAEQAIAALSVGGDEEDKHPEKRMKAAYKAYAEVNMPILKEDNPGLKLSQYKDMLFKQWQKSAENPMNSK
mmetsp:Transcript_36189/g.71158  ORF Transcript_36189/g.71158 Transcript_36189/m.71158 type:complete len:213 (-) Transcript_36189:104-742(-)|eukprot:CAMPEP_0175095302 /NCGR_PEP_ID=MMETSP0086_2-20121207/4075_1 /TAXON_ID=136419 /ORGANISM="Unknown Unknown, Strain D1" /LENGTH=212 /DNA_ID=CAMNT_0016368525 /DNA_START=50 /DNA_END=688 /DNA_ORIENTATION=-